MPTVLHLIESWGPGGAETVFLDVATEIRDRGWTSLAAVPREGWVSRSLRDRDFAPIFAGGGQGSWDVQHLSELIAIIRRDHVNLVHAHLFGSALYGGVAATVSRIPSVATFHGDWDLRGATGYRRMKFPIVNWACDRRVFVSEPLRRTCVDEYGMKTDGSAVIENGIDTERYQPREDVSFRRELGIGEDEFLVGAVGNVRPAKNHGMLLRVASRLDSRESGAHVVLVGKGEGELFERLRHERRELGLEASVHFAGFREDVDRVLNNLDAYVLTSDSEGFSLTTVQAMSSGLPVVATMCGGPEVLIDDGRTGFLVDPGDVTGMAEVLSRLRSDPGLRSRVGRSAREEAVRRWSMDRMVDGYERLYRDVLGHGAGAATGS